MSTRKATIRKITPVSADDAPSTTAAEKQLQLHMEENFFHNQPASLKRVVEFVGERTASNFIKRLRSSSLTQAFTSAKETVGKLVAGLSGISPNPRIKEKLSHDVSREAGYISERVRKEVTVTVHEYCHRKTMEILPSLLPEEQIGAVVTISVSISCRQAEERVMQWVNNHITTRIFQREMSEELEKMCRPVNLQKTVQSAPTWRNTSTVVSDSCPKAADKHDDNLLGPTDVLTETKVYVRNVILYKKDPSLEGVTNCVKRVSDTISSRQDILPEAYKAISQLLQDLALYLLCYRPELWTDSICSMCMTMWTSYLKEHTFFGSVISPRLLNWMKKDHCLKIGSKPICEYVRQLLQKSLLTPSQLNKSAFPLLGISLKMGLFVDVAEMLMDILRSEAKRCGDLESYTDLIDGIHQNLVTLGEGDLLRKLDALTTSADQEILAIPNTNNSDLRNHQTHISKDLTPNDHVPPTSSIDPVTSDQYPATSNQDPASSSHDPAISNQIPPTSNQDPASSSHDPAISNQIPATSNQDPGSTCSNHDPATSNQDQAFCSKESVGVSDKFLSMETVSEACPCSSHKSEEAWTEELTCMAPLEIACVDNAGSMNRQVNSTDSSSKEQVTQTESRNLDSIQSLQNENVLESCIYYQQHCLSENTCVSQSMCEIALSNQSYKPVLSNCYLPAESGDNEQTNTACECTGCNQHSFKCVGNNNIMQGHNLNCDKVHISDRNSDISDILVTNANNFSADNLK